MSNYPLVLSIFMMKRLLQFIALYSTVLKKMLESDKKLLQYPPVSRDVHSFSQVGS